MTKSQKTAENYIIIIFGVTGDLTKRKLIPALYKLYEKGILKENTPIVSVARRNLPKSEFVRLLDINQFIPHADKKILREFLKRMYYFPLNFQSENLSGFTAFINKIEEEYKCKGNKIFYLATPQDLFEQIVGIIKSAGLLKGSGWKKVVFEKPFGYDLASARKLNSYISSVFSEKEIYRIDHYLAKELVQNILVFRFANSVFEQIWNNKFVDHVQITIAEKLGVETRGIYYDKAGAVRDIVQNHLLQVLSLSAMEPPKSMNADDIRDEKFKVLRALQKVSPDEVVIGQYGSGIIDGKEVLPYLKELNVPPESETETFAALKIYINNKRWEGVPFYVRTGKRLAKSYAEINLILKDVASHLFRESSIFKYPNIITIRIQPDEGIVIKFNAKYPGPKINLHPVIMEYCHHCLFALNTPEAYETLLQQIIIGDQTLFTRWDGVEESWKFIDFVLDIVKNKKKNFPNYKAGSFGPKEADDMLKKDEREWCLPKDIGK